MKVVIDYDQMNKYKALYKIIQQQISEDYIGETGSYMPKEDLAPSAVVCLLTQSFKKIDE